MTINEFLALYTDPENLKIIIFDLTIGKTIFADESALLPMETSWAEICSWELPEGKEGWVQINVEL